VKRFLLSIYFLSGLLLAGAGLLPASASVTVTGYERGAVVTKNSSLPHTELELVHHFVAHATQPTQRILPFYDAPVTPILAARSVTVTRAEHSSTQAFFSKKYLRHNYPAHSFW
jgi:hypothetical protein